jgi:hypothetical protein
MDFQVTNKSSLLFIHSTPFVSTRGFFIFGGEVGDLDGDEEI